MNFIFPETGGTTSQITCTTPFPACLSSHQWAVQMPQGREEIWGKTGKFTNPGSNKKWFVDSKGLWGEGQDTVLLLLQLQPDYHWHRGLLKNEWINEALGAQIDHLDSKKELTGCPHHPPAIYNASTHSSAVTTSTAWGCRDFGVWAYSADYITTNK